MFDSLYPDATETALDARARRAPEPVDTPWFKNGWKALGQAIPRAGAEMGRAGTALLTPEAVGAMDAPSMFSAPGKTSKPQLADEIRAQDKALAGAIKEFTPNPESTGAASMILHDVTRFVGKAAAYGALGGAPAAVAGMALDEGTNETLRRMDEGVDTATAVKLGVTKGIASGVAVALPVAGSGVAQTVGLAVAGGPGSYIAENLTARQILQSADYTKEAAAIDPFDPLGLGVSFFGSLLFGAGSHAMRGRGRATPDSDFAKTESAAARSPEVAPGEKTPVAQAVERAYTPEQVDAAHVAILQHQRESTALHAADDLAASAGHARALDQASEQLAAGRRVEVADVAPVDAARVVEHVLPAVGRIEAAVRELQAVASTPTVAESAERVKLQTDLQRVEAELARLQPPKINPDPIDLHDDTPRGRSYDEFTPEEKVAYDLRHNIPPGRRDEVATGLARLELQKVESRIAAARYGQKQLDVASGFGGEFKAADVLRTAAEDLNKARLGLQAAEMREALVKLVAKEVHSATPKAEAAPESAPTGDPVTDAITTAARAIEDALKPPETAKPAEPVADFLTREADRIEQADPNMMVMMEGMDGPVPVRELLAEAKAMAEQEMADAPLLQVAAECALRG